MADLLQDKGNMEEFLDKIDELESIVKGFRTDDENEAKEAMEKADKLIKQVEKAKQKVKNNENNEDLPVTRTGFSKTSINKSTDEAPGQNDVNYDGMDNVGFMKAVESDAKERAKKRKERMKIAEDLKEKGNAEFRQGNYETALDWYTQALREVKDCTAIYTNRAQTYIKLGKYPEAIIDCEWALRVFPNCLKAHIHMGRAHLCLKEFSEARECYKKALVCDPKKDALIQDYLAEVDRFERAENEEKDAEAIFKEGNEEKLGVVEVLTRVQKPEQLPVFYSGGLRILKSLMLTTPDRTLFRTKGGLELITSLPTLHSCISASPKSLSGEQLDMLTSAFEMYSEACRDNEKSTEQILQTAGLPAYCLGFLQVKMKGQGKILKLAIVDFLYTLSQLTIGQKTIVETFDVPQLLAAVFNMMRNNNETASIAANLLNNLALEKKFKSMLRGTIEETVSPSFEKLLVSDTPTRALPRCVTMVMNLTTDTTIRSKLMLRKPLWISCCTALELHRPKLEEVLSQEIIESVLGLMLNLTKDSSESGREFGVTICSNCLQILQSTSCPAGILQRSMGVLSHVLPHCVPAVDNVVERGGTELLLNYVRKEDSESMKPAMKSLTALTQVNEVARKFVVDNRGLGCLIKRLKSEDEIIVGNAALCLSHCTQVPKMCTALTQTDIIKDLLVLARDGRRPAVQQNCAILIAKLAQGDSKHLERLRELHGIEILHSCMKFIK